MKLVVWTTTKVATGMKKKADIKII
jgi:hypothetical protein